MKINLILLTVIGGFLNTPWAYAKQPMVRMVLFFAPSCPHCNEVMEEVLPPLVEKYDNQLDIVGIDVSLPLGQELYQATVTRYHIQENRLIVPTMVVGDIILVGSEEIPWRLPGIIEEGLASGGMDWPDIPGLQQVLAAQPTLHAQEAAEDKSTSPPPFVQRFANDLLANHIAVIVLAGMIVSAIGVGYSFIKGTESRFLNWPKWITPLLAIAGLGVALYLSYVEVLESDAVCGPIGDCNSVQKSPYAYLFGVIPIGAIGVIGYLAILITWVLQEKGPPLWRKYFSLSIWGMGWFGILFSIYLTFLEPFVIGATCAWCITSSIIMTLILLASTDSVKKALTLSEEDVWSEGEIEQWDKDQSWNA